MSVSKKKIEAIYALRGAAEEKALAERANAEHPSPASRSDLLDAQLDLEAKTMTAIETCHECGHDHAPGASHVVNELSENVLQFRQREVES